MAKKHDGQPLRMLTVMDEYTRECLRMKGYRQITSHDVIDELLKLFVYSAAFLNIYFLDNGHGGQMNMDRTQSAGESGIKVVNKRREIMITCSLILEPLNDGS
jgi:hypothetical protein